MLSGQYIRPDLHSFDYGHIAQRVDLGDFPFLHNNITYY